MHGKIRAIDELDICASYLQNPEKIRQSLQSENAVIAFSPYAQGDFDQLYLTNRLRFKEKSLPDDFYKLGL